MPQEFLFSLKHVWKMYFSSLFFFCGFSFLVPRKQILVDAVLGGWILNNLFLEHKISTLLL